MLFRYDRKFSIAGRSVRLFRAGNRFAALRAEEAAGGYVWHGAEKL